MAYFFIEFVLFQKIEIRTNISGSALKQVSKIKFFLNCVDGRNLQIQIPDESLRNFHSTFLILLL